MQANCQIITFLVLLATSTTVFCFLMSRSPRSVDNVDLIVQTSTGPVKGLKMISGHGKEVDAFLGIPYAKPPIGDLRFRRPEPIEPWIDVFDATKLPNSCVQRNDTTFGTFEGSVMWNPNTPVNEDCLSLSVYVPKPSAKDGSVLVWIHGGGFYSGTSTLDFYDPKVLVSEEEIILVSINYRLASLGFLFLDRPDVPGNVGLYDQLLALEWIRDNIGYFGGDPEKVTIFGESAGAGSVGLHLLSPLSRDVFNQAVLQSGSPTAPWAVLDKEESIKRSLKLAEIMGCPSDRSQLDTVLECLRKSDPYEMVIKEWGVSELGIVDFPFSPVVNGDFLVEMPEQSLANGNYKKANIIIGSNEHEGTYFLLYFLPEYFANEEEVYITHQQFIDSVKKLFPKYGEIGQEAIIFEYTNWNNPEDTVKNRQAIDKMVAEVKFNCHVNELAHSYAETGNNVYMYHFDHRASSNPWPDWAGVMHGYEIKFVLGQPLNETLKFTKLEKELSQKMMRYWSNFARTGDPNVQLNGEHEPVSWPLHSTNGREYMTLAVDSHEVQRDSRVQQCVFWKKYMPKLLLQTTGKFNC